MIDGLKLEQYLEAGRQILSPTRRERIATLSRAERVRLTLEELGPTFIKMGQILSTRPDLVPIEFTSELEKLQTEVPPFPFQEAKEIIEEELHSPLAKLYRSFEEVPLAAASIGQVHRATTIKGEEVVVKVQRPQTRETVEVDLEIMRDLARLLERYVEGFELQRPSLVVEELAHTLERELDYAIEISHIERFARQFADERKVYVPKVYRATSSTRVLTMEYIDGVRASDFEGLARLDCNRRKLARRGADLIMQQIFVHGFFHADPHPGNVVVLPRDVICYLDFGMMGRVNRQAREEVVDLVLAVAARDESRVTDAVLNLTRYEREPERRTLERDISEFVDQHLFLPLKEVELGRVLHQLLVTASRHRLRIPPDIFLMIKALGTAEAVGCALDPDFNITEHAKPFVRRVHLQRYHPRRLADEVVDTATELLHLVKDIPGELREILRQAKQGKVHIEFEHRGLEPMMHTLDRVSNQLAFSVVLGSLLIGSSLVLAADVPPKWNDVPVFGLAGFIIAGLMSIWLLMSILRRGRM